MMILRFVYLPFLLFPALTYAQELFFSSLATEVCACMETITDQPPRVYARRCLRSAAQGKARAISDALDRAFDPERPADIDLLAEQLIQPLAENCPFLQAFYEREPEPELRWSDQTGTTEKALRYTFPKDPPPDPTGQIQAEQPPVTVLVGTVLEITRNRIRLETGNGIRNMEIPGKLRRTLNLKVGEDARISCRREWRVEEGVIVLVVVESESA